MNIAPRISSLLAMLSMSIASAVDGLAPQPATNSQVGAPKTSRNRSNGGSFARARRDSAKRKNVLRNRRHHR